VERVGLNPGQDLRPGLVNPGQYARQFRQDGTGSTGADDHDLLFTRPATIRAESLMNIFGASFRSIAAMRLPTGRE
jgi:hypothetical protein